MCIGQRSTWKPSLGKLTAPAVAQPASLDLRTQCTRRGAAALIAACRVRQPGRITPLRKALQESHSRIVGFTERPQALPVACPSDVTRSLAVTSLTADADF